MPLSPTLRRRSSMSGAEALLEFAGGVPVLKRLAPSSCGSAGSDTASPSENGSPEMKRPRQNPAPSPLRTSMQMQQVVPMPLAPVQTAPVHKPIATLTTTVPARQPPPAVAASSAPIKAPVSKKEEQRLAAVALNNSAQRAVAEARRQRELLMPGIVSSLSNGQPNPVVRSRRPQEFRPTQMAQAPQPVQPPQPPQQQIVMPAQQAPIYNMNPFTQSTVATGPPLYIQPRSGPPVVIQPGAGVPYMYYSLPAQDGSSALL
tara:strand:+ start:2351 stop:3130 length:780 start_codon:yes stop_codon:yes gene_type:complete